MQGCLVPALLIPVCVFNRNIYVSLSLGATMRSVLSVMRLLGDSHDFLFWLKTWLQFFDGSQALPLTVMAGSLLGPEPEHFPLIWKHLGSGQKCQNTEQKKEKKNQQEKNPEAIGSSKRNAGRSKEKEISCYCESADQKSDGRLWIAVWKSVFMRKVYGITREDLEQRYIFTWFLLYWNVGVIYGS